MSCEVRYLKAGLAHFAGIAKAVLKSTFFAWENVGQTIMSRTALITHADCLLHVPPAGHPESPARLAAVIKALEAAEFANLVRLDAPLAQDSDIERVHPRHHIDAIERRSPQEGQRAVSIDADTFMSLGTLQAARRGVGAVIAGVDAMMSGTVDRAFCATRPPGHHAQSDQAMGFCIWNSAAIGALYARAAYGLQRVAVIDFDVHHGNGSQEMALRDSDFFYASVHQGGIYPGSGFEHETAFGNLVNVPLPDQTTSQPWRGAIAAKILPALAAFAPQIVIVSAGFDGHRLDPLASFNLEAEDFAWVTQELLKLTGGKLVSTLEGGYHLEALIACVTQHVRAFIEYDKHAGGVASRG
jgi:acetoin utilization deacetylase AcuC-like enzyme